MLKTKDQLYKIWENVWEYHGWLNILEMSKAYDEEDITYLEEIDERVIETEIEARKYYREVEIPKIRKQVKEFSSEFSPEFKKERRLSYLNNEIENLEKKIERIYLDYEESTKLDVPFFLRSAIKDIKDPARLERKLRGLTVEKHLLEHPEDSRNVNRVSPEEVAKALAFPFTELLEFNKANFANCPFHKEKVPSFHLIVKNNRAHCFSCGWTGSTIDYLMKINDWDFKRAVRKLL